MTAKTFLFSMAGPSTVDNFWATFSDLRRILYRKVSLLSLVLLPFIVQIIIIGSFIELESNRACNTSELCWYTNRTSGITDDSPVKHGEINFAEQGTILHICHFFGMFIGLLILGPVADVVGRCKVLFPASFVALVAALLSAFFLKSLAMFIVLRSLVGFASGGAILVIFILTAEYVDPSHRALALAALWIVCSLATIILAALSYLVKDHQSLLVATSSSLVLGVLLWKFIPESPRWSLLNTRRSTGEEAQTLLQRFVKDPDQRQQAKYGICWKMWGRVENEAPSREIGFTFLRRKEARKTTAVVAFVWFAGGMLYCGLNSSSIQLFSAFYSNYAVRELANFPAIIIYLILGSWFGRRLTILISLVFSGLFCVIFSVASDGFLVSEHNTVALVIQFVGRMFLVTSIASICLYSVELFPTTVRCAAIGLVFAVGCIGSAVAPILIKSLSSNPVVPLGIMGLVTMVAGVMCRCLLPETKGTFTAETYEDNAEMRQFQKSWSPKVTRRRKEHTENSDQEDGVTETEAQSSPIDITRSDEFESLRQSWEVSFDRASRTSRWEMLSYEDAKRSLLSVSLEQLLDVDSQLLSDEDIKKLSKHVPSENWILVYSTYTHGMSLKTLYSRCTDLETSVMIVIKDDNGFVFGVFSPRAPKVEPHFCGYGKSFFFRLKPEFKVYPCSGKNAYYMIGDNGGLAFGCSEGQFGLWLDTELYHGRNTACETYNSEMMSATEDFLCHGLEAWTFG